ncbi:hypothetical protein KR074_003305, partial [Drosophila pseudoananassae]
AMAPPALPAGTEPEPAPAPSASNLPVPTRSNIPTPASSVTGIPVASKLKAPSSFGSTGSVSKIGRACCNHTTPKAGPPPRDTASMSRESDDLSSINSAYTDLYQETVRRFTRSSLSPTSDWDRFSPARRSLKSEAGSRTSYDYYLEATGRRRSSDHNSAVLTANTDQFIIGQRVWVGGIRSGKIAYIGETHFAPGDWAGIVLDEPNGKISTLIPEDLLLTSSHFSGKNDGCVSGKRYFQCEPKCGIFSRLTRLTTYPMSGDQTPTSPLAKNSPDRSRTVSPTASIRSSMLRSPGICKNGLTVGDRVIVSSGFGSRPGLLRYLGETQFAPGNWCGVELDEASGKNDGAVDGIRYFECKPKYGVFVPIAKVSLSPSSKKTRLSRTGSRESLTSIGTMNSIATTNTSRMRMNAQQRKSSTPVKPILATPKSQFSMQDLLREKQQHVEQLMVERDLDREDAQNQALQLQKNINELKARIVELETELGDERKKSEELQFSVDEAQFCGDELNAQSQVYKEKIHDLESKITNLVSATPSLQSVPPPASPPDDSAFKEEIAQLQEKLSAQQREAESRMAEQQEEEQRLRENVKYLQEQNATLQAELVGKDESLEKFSLSQSGIENLRRELALLKEENEKQALEAQADFALKLSAKSEELDKVSCELLRLKAAADSLESERANKTDECEILQTEVRMRDEQIKDLSEKVDELTTQLNVQKADSSALDEMLKLQQAGGAEKDSFLEQSQKELVKLKEEVAKNQEEKEQLQKQLLEAADQEKLVREELESEINKVKAEKEAAEQQVAAKQTELDACQREQAETNYRLLKAKDENTEKDLQIDESNFAIQKLHQLLEHNAHAEESLRVTHEQLKKRQEETIKEKDSQLQELQTRFSETENALQTSQTQLEQLQHQVAASDEKNEKNLAKMNEVISQLKVDYEKAEVLVKSSESDAESIAKLLEAANGALDEETKKAAKLQEEI